MGFMVLKEVQERLPQVPPGAKLVIGGTLAEKQGVRFRMNPELGVLGMQGTDIEQVMNEYDQIEELAKNNFSVDLISESRFYEILAELVIISKKDPIAVISSMFEGQETLKQLGNILGTNVTNYGVRLVPANKSPTDEEWLEYKIEPLVAKPHTSYQASVIFRSKAKEKVKETASNLLSSIQTILNSIEK
jgi:hypothetical protein